MKNDLWECLSMMKFLLMNLPWSAANRKYSGMFSSILLDLTLPVHPHQPSG
jgi:hypothetical protein